MKWEKFDEGWAMPIKSWCADCEEGAVKQAENLARHFFGLLAPQVPGLSSVKVWETADSSAEYRP